MFRFEDPEYLYLLLIIPALVIIFIITSYRGHRRMKKYGDWKLVSALVVDYSKSRPVVKFIFMLVAFALAVVMVARPQFGTKVDTTQRRGIEAVIAVDVSNSMMATDVSPNRLERAKMLVSTLVDKMSDDKVGLDVFAGDAFVQLPITQDYVSAKMFLESINPGMITLQGTDLAAAIDLASRSFTQAKGVGRAIILITDGEGHEAGAEEAAQKAAKDGKRVFVLGIGSKEGAPIPTANGYLKDNTGQEVISKLDENMCRDLAKAGNGAYIHVDNSMSAQEELARQMQGLAKKDLNSPVYSDYDEQFQAFGILILVFLILEICIVEVKNPFFKRLNLFHR